MDKSVRDLIECAVLFGGIAAGLVGLRAVYRAMARLGWVQPEDYRPRQTALGNAMLSIQSIFEPSKKHVLEQKVTRRRKHQASGEPPHSASHSVE